MSNEDMMRAGMARRASQSCPTGGGRSNGGRVAKAAYASGGNVQGGNTPPPLGGTWAAPKGPQQPSDSAASAATTATKPHGLFAGGGRVRAGR